ncbi:hypothetical protein P5V15_001170 [Pogonomyrmex californicus]
MENDTWMLVDKSNRNKVVDCRTILRNKYKTKNELERPVSSPRVSCSVQVSTSIIFLPQLRDSTIYMEKPELLRQMLERIVATEDAELTQRAKEMTSKLETGDKMCKFNKSLYVWPPANRAPVTFMT